MVDFADVDTLAAGYHQRGGQPGLAYGIVIGGELVHAAGLGERHLGGPPPDADTVFRIASMTKSFTASAILALRDDGQLRLDDLAEDYVPELRGWPLVSPDSARISIRHLLTMTAGFPTDDPWGDRQQGLPLEEFATFLAGGVSFAWAPGTRFEYSNLGYAILGRVITAVTGVAYPDYIRHLLLRPLGMTRTGYEAEEFEVPGQQTAGPAGVARGYRRSPGGWSEVAFDPAGAFAPMGGIFSCVRDLTRWVAGFAAAFPPGDGEAADAHPVRRASRREMQLPQVLTGWAIAPSFPRRRGVFAPGHLRLRAVRRRAPRPGPDRQPQRRLPGVRQQHGLAPGDGNRRDRAGQQHLRGDGAAGRPAARGCRAAGRARRARERGGARLAGPWPETLAAREAVSNLLQTWDDAAAQRLFSPNVAMDAPFAERQRRIALVRERIGDFGDDPGRQPEFDTPAQCRWWLAGKRGTVQVQIQLNPERPPRVQSLTLAVPPAAGSALRVTLDAVVDWLNDGDRDWPPSIPVADGVDTGLVARRLRMAALWIGRCRVGAVKAGDGTASVAAELAGEHATITLALVIDPETRLLRMADVAP